jgi:hypothetical protein
LIRTGIGFDEQIAPILVSHCLECHRGSSPEGSLNLTEQALAQKGGDSGEANVAGHAAKSLLWERVSSNEMPPKHPLSDSKKAMLKQWIDKGANWGDGGASHFERNCTPTFTKPSVPSSFPFSVSSKSQNSLHCL